MSTPGHYEARTTSRASGLTADSGVGLNSDSESGEMAEKKVTFPSSGSSKWYSKLCCLMVEGSQIAMRETFNKIYPPLILADKLTTRNMKNRFQLLHARGILDDHQWKMIYPKNKKQMSSEHYDLMLLSSLLREICHLSAPYPHGWNQMPEERDYSISGNIARVNATRKGLVRKSEMSDEEALDYWPVVLGTLMELGGEKCLPKADKIYREEMSEETQRLWISRLKTWHEKECEKWQGKLNTRKYRESIGSDAIRRSQMSITPAQRQSSSRLRRARLQAIDGGLPREEHETMQRFYQPLITNVKVTDIIEQLVKSETLTHEEQNAIYCKEKNRQRMDALINILLRKPANAYLQFTKAIRFKHSHLYEMMSKTYNGLKKELADEKPDSLLRMTEMLQTNQKHMCSRWRAIPWLENIQHSIRDFYVQQQFINANGHSVMLQDLFRSDDPQSILIVGQSGSGKTTLCKRLVYDWLSDNIFLHNLFGLVFYVDLTKMKGSLTDHIYEEFDEQLLMERDELCQMIEANQRDILFIFDDYNADNADNDNDEVNQITMRRMLPNCSILMTSSSTPTMFSHFQERYSLLGLRRHNITDLVRLYMELTNAPLDQVSTLFQALQSDIVRELAVKPFFCLCLCTLATTNGVDLSTIVTESILLEHFVNCIKGQHSGPTREMRNLALRSLQHIQQAALQASMTHTRILSCDGLKSEFDNNYMYRFGLLNKRHGEVTCGFICKALQDFLAGLHLKEMGATEFQQYCDRLVTDSWFYDICRYVCGLRRQNKITEPLKLLVTNLAEENLKRCRKICFVWNETGEILGISEGRIGDFSLSLECLYEMNGRDDMCEVISKSLPEKLILRSSGVTYSNMILGLAKLIKINKHGPRLLEILFDCQTDMSERAMMLLAKAMHTNYQVNHLKVEWKTDNLFAQFLSVLFQGNVAIECIKLVDMYSNSDMCKTPATVRADLLQACKNMKFVKMVTLYDCQAPMLVNSVIHGVPLSVEDLDLTGCTFNPVTSQELSYHLDHTRALTTLNLTNVHLAGMCFRYIMKGLRSNQSLRELILRETNIDKPGQIALAEALKFNHHLRRLDLSRNELTHDGCIQLSQALTINRRLRELILLGSRIDRRYLDVMKAYKHPLLCIVEDSSRPQTSVIVAD